MSRVLSYLGIPVDLHRLLYQSYNALSKQALTPKLSHTASLGGTGLIAWDKNSHDADMPFHYHSKILPLHDASLLNLSKKLRPSNLIVNITDIPDVDIEPGVNPNTNHRLCIYPISPIAFTHDGYICAFHQIQKHLIAHIKPEIFQYMQSHNDSEYLFALLLSQMKNFSNLIDADELFSIIQNTVNIICHAMAAENINGTSVINLFLSDINQLFTCRLVIGYGHDRQIFNNNTIDHDDLEKIAALSNHAIHYRSLWYTHGERYDLSDENWESLPSKKIPDSIIIASEPLSQDIDHWHEVPPYSAINAKREHGKLSIYLRSFDDI